jgi:hypothetical protein
MDKFFNRLNMIFNLLFGAICVILGVKIIWKPVYYNKRLERVIDVSGYNIPLGCVMIIFGILFIYLQVRQGKRK